jgi:ribosomal protein S19E (S16A)
MHFTTLRDVPTPALIQRVSQYLRQNSITCVPDWMKLQTPPANLDQLTAWWYSQAATSITHCHRTPMRKPRMDAGLTGQAIRTIIWQFEQLGWIQIDRTGIMIVPRDCARQLLRVVNQTKNELHLQSR